MYLLYIFAPEPVTSRYTDYENPVVSKIPQHTSSWCGAYLTFIGRHWLGGTYLCR
jgi:hypothetical protein